MQNENFVDLVSGEDSMFNPTAVEGRLAKMIESFDVPEWILDGGKRKCPECGAVLSLDCIREVGLCLNAQHIGNIQVEILCKECDSGYYLMFRKACKNFREFSESVAKYEFETRHFGEPIQGHKIKPHENNLTDVMVEEKRNEGKTEGQTCP